MSYRLVVSMGLVMLFTCAASFFAYAQLPPPPAKQSLADVYTGKSYSPYAGRGFPSRIYWGDTHLHTAMSFDAGSFGNRLGLDEAYRFARGEEIISSTGVPAKLSRPLDWLMVADHSDNMGFFPDLLAGEYAREALKRGLVIEKKLGTNPYKFGMIGSTDSHTSLATAQEDNFFGKHSGYEPGPGRMSHPFFDSEVGTLYAWQQVSSGLAAVWADPDFNPDQKAFYYARVIEIPTPRWSTYDAFRYGIELPKGVPTATLERAYTSPIWYTP